MEPQRHVFVDPLLHSAPTQRSRPGRPRGSKGKVLQEARALGVHHFAFVRSSLLGLDLAEAFSRYMAWFETTTDLRYIQNRRDALLKQDHAPLGPVAQRRTDQSCSDPAQPGRPG